MSHNELLYFTFWVGSRVSLLKGEMELEYVLAGPMGSSRLVGSPECQILEISLYPGAEGAGGILELWVSPKCQILKKSLYQGAEGAGKFSGLWYHPKAKSLRNPYIPAPKAPGEFWDSGMVS